MNSPFVDCTLSSSVLLLSNSPYTDTTVTQESKLLDNREYRRKVWLFIARKFYVEEKAVTATALFVECTSFPHFNMVKYSIQGFNMTNTKEHGYPRRQKKAGSEPLPIIPTLKTRPKEGSKQCKI